MFSAKKYILHTNIIILVGLIKNIIESTNIFQGEI